MDRKFDYIKNMEPGYLWTGESDDPVDDEPDFVGSPRDMIDLDQFTDVADWDD